MSMSNKEFSEVLREIELAGGICTAMQLRSRDTAQREALARVEAERDEALEFMRINARSGMSYAEQRDQYRDLYNASIGFADRYKAERDTAQAQLAEAVGLLRYIYNHNELALYENGRIEDFLSRNAQAEQQEAQGAQAGDEDAAFMVWAEREYQTAPDEELNLKHVDVIQNRKGWMARAALATQLAVPDKDQFPKTVAGFFEGESCCLGCGKRFTLYYNGGELDSHECCGFKYMLEHSGEVDLVIYDVRGAEHDQ